MSSPLSDGFTIQHTISADKSSLPPVTFRYRPPTGDQAEEYFYQAGRAQSGKARAAAVTAFLLGQLVSWDVRPADGADTVPVTEDAVRRLAPPLRALMIDAVLSYAGEQLAGDQKN